MRKIALALIIFLSFSFSGLEIQGQQYYTLDSDSRASVVQIVDGDAFIATLIPSGKPVLVRMIGVDAQAYDPSVKYLTTALLGSTVRLVKDYNYSYPSGRWSLAYVYKDDLLINAELLRTGNAKINASHENATLYSTLKQEEDSASSRKVGIWGNNLLNVYMDYQYTGNGININKASASQLSQRLKISSSVAESIVYYRNSNPFSNIREIKFVDGFTKEMFDSNRDQLVVSTNINIASEEELITLSNLSSTDVKNILSYRAQNTFSSVDNLYDKSVISSYKLSSIKPYISTDTIFEIEYTTPSSVVNINTANTSQLRSAGLSDSQANRIIEYRSNYSYKTLRELNELFSFSTTQVNSYEDNLHLYTDINKATRQELESLLGDSASSDLLNKIVQAQPFSGLDGLKALLSASLYNSIAPYIYINNKTAEYINVNTASRTELQALGLSSGDASRVVSAQANMNTSKKLPSVLNGYKDSISLYTNINTASQKELLSLNKLMTADIAAQIILYRDNQPFGDTQEVYDFFYNISQSELYSSIRSFITVR